jgi:hypothetical protein
MLVSSPNNLVGATLGHALCGVESLKMTAGRREGLMEEAVFSASGRKAWRTDGRQQLAMQLVEPFPPPSQSFTEANSGCSRGKMSVAPARENARDRQRVRHVHISVIARLR